MGKTETKEEKEKQPVRNRWLKIIFSAALMIVFDQLTKHLAAAFLMNREAKVLIPGVLELRYLENRGAAFSMLQNRQWFFYILTAVFLVICFAVIKRTPSVRKYNAFTGSITVLAAGAVGNLIDRIVHRYVIDYIYFSIINFPIFNVADIYVTFGVIFLIIFVLFKYKDEDMRVIFSGKHS